MVTVDFHELNLKPGARVLDAGCGSGRHLRGLAKLPGLKIFGIDRNARDVADALDGLKNMPDALSCDYRVETADINALPFDDAFFDCVICSEVLEHVPEHEQALSELVRVLKPKGHLVVSVPRYFSEKICWLISRAYHNEEGGHIRIYKKRTLRRMLDRQGITCWKINYKHALHAPYWWLKCLVGLKNEKNILIRFYKKFLEWDIMSKPKAVRMLEQILNPLIGKSIVFYLKKG
ncbi:MAG: class I SAM-dependent methyltransferase [Deltaproteobacteria bacterium]